MKIQKRQTETYILTELNELDPVTVYVTNYQLGQGKIVIECCGDAWAHYWDAMGDRTLQEFVVEAETEYFLIKLLQQTRQTDFAKICTDADALGFDICATNDIELGMSADDMFECFGDAWMKNLPRCYTNEYWYLYEILEAVKAAFKDELS